ncbi:MAG TPA: nitroreductase family protein, partial [Dehalococcoidia bacterium]|nr:nitroreductase family protein [Dehalococcoidia bacterium]
LTIAQQAPAESNRQSWSWVIVTDPAKRAAIGELYRKAWYEIYLNLPFAAPNLKFDDPARDAVQRRVTASAQYLADHIHEVLVHVVPCISPRTDGLPHAAHSALWGTIAPAAWSFMLAARARGLGTTWTSLHLFFEEQAAEILGIPHREVMQAALIPVAYAKGTDFKPAPRDPLESTIHWEGW